MTFAAPTTAREVADALSTLFGDDFAPTPGVLATMATWDAPTGRFVLRVGAGAPKSATDFFVLQHTRARADAIVTTGKILRDEPRLAYDLEGSPAQRDALHAYRSDVLGKRHAAKVYVLTSGKDLDLEHPAFRSWATPVLAVPDDATSAVLDEAARRGIAIERFARLDVRALVTSLRTRFETVTIEAGVTTARSLYDAPSLVDELVLGRFLGPTLTDAAKGAAFLDDAALERALGPRRSDHRVDEPSGPWAFARYRR